jgi:hypothetical protein
MAQTEDMTDLVNRNVEQVDVSAGRVPTLGVVEVQAAILGKEPVATIVPAPSNGEPSPWSPVSQPMLILAGWWSE